jgi:radical SAM superfamily enzyme YgiQ (UPF0313 family)
MEVGVRVHLINPSHISFGTAVITPRWLYVLAGATPKLYGDPILVDETLKALEPSSISPGDVVGIGIHTGNALRGYEIGVIARERGAKVVYGGIHATLYPEEACSLGGAHAVVKGDGDVVWSRVLADCQNGLIQSVYDGGRISANDFASARWDLMERKRYMWASVQTVRGCPKHCSFCSVWRTDGQEPRQRGSDAVINEIVELRRMGFRFIALADDNFYPVTLTDLKLAEKQKNHLRVEELKAIRAERFELMGMLAKLPSDSVFYTQITMEAAEDPEFLKAMKAAHILGALVGVEAVTPEGLKDVYKGFNAVGEELVTQLKKFRENGIYILGSFIFGLPSDRPSTFDATAAIANRADLAFAQFVMLTPFPGTIDFMHWEKTEQAMETKVAGIPLSRRWLIPQELRPKLSWPHPVMSHQEIASRTQGVWDTFYSMPAIWQRSSFLKSIRARLAFLLISKVYRQMYADSGISSDSARANSSARWARWLAKPCQKLFAGRPMPDLQMPQAEPVVGLEVSLGAPAM